MVLRISVPLRGDPARRMPFLHPRRRSTDGAGPRQDPFLGFVRRLAKGGALRFGRPCGPNLQGALPLLAALLFWTGTACATEALSPFEDPGTQLWGYRDPRGAVVIAPRFAVAQEFSARGIAAVADASGWTIINRTGKVLIPRPYLLDNGPDPFQEGLARFTEAGRVGFFDERGQVVIPARFAFVAPFSEGRAAFCEGCREQAEGEHRSVQGGRWGFIDRSGTVVITARFGGAESFAQGRASVMQDGRWITIDRQGHPVVEQSSGR